LSDPASRFGVTAVVGRPNVGKSTLVNRLLGERLCITASRPQTTRHRILGVVTHGNVQIALVDTPGIHGNARRRLNRALNRSAAGALAGVDLALFVVAAGHWGEDDERVAGHLRGAGVSVLGVVNRVDQIRDKTRLLPYLAELDQRLEFAAIVPVSARRGDNVDALQDEIVKHLPAGEHGYAADTLTDRSERFLAAELVREPLTRGYGDEVPHALSVEIERFERAPDGRLTIGAVICVEREGQKGILIGRGGDRLKDVGRRARRAMEQMFDAPVYLDLWVKVRAGWSDDARALRELGYDEE